LVINGKPLTTYFKGETIKKMIYSPFVVADVLGQYTGSIKVAGGGSMGQAEAIMHGIGRALLKADPEKFKKLMRDGGFLTRDPRMKETRKAGQGGRARAKKQSPKR
jgi:small subunit ribosomal protein S9